MKVFVLGINHRSAPIAIREKFAIPHVRIPEFLSRAVALPHIEELVALSTCNRVELYGVSSHPLQAKQQLSLFLAEFHGEEPVALGTHLYFHEGEAALRHGFRVASSLDSMIVGEPQILGQMKEAYRLANEANTTGRFLHKFFQHTFHVAKKLRSETAIASHPVSVSYAAVVLARQIFGDLSGKTALILGAGKMSELAIRHLKNEGVEKLLIANRTARRAEEIANKLGGEIIPFDNFAKWLADADVVLTSTGSKDYLIGHAQVQEAMHLRKNRPMFFIDIAVPRNVSPEVNHLANVYLYDIDDLGAVIEANKSEREKETEKATALLAKEVVEFSRVLQSLQVVPTLSSLSKKFDKICRQELDKAFQKLPQLDAEGRGVVEGMAQSIASKLLHDPMVTLKEEMPAGERGDYTAIVRKLFRLDET